MNTFRFSLVFSFSQRPFGTLQKRDSIYAAAYAATRRRDASRRTVTCRRTDAHRSRSSIWCSSDDYHRRQKLRALFTTRFRRLWKPRYDICCSDLWLTSYRSTRIRNSAAMKIDGTPRPNDPLFLSTQPPLPTSSHFASAVYDMTYNYVLQL